MCFDFVYIEEFLLYVKNDLSFTISLILVTPANVFVIPDESSINCEYFDFLFGWLH